MATPTRLLLLLAILPFAGCDAPALPQQTEIDRETFVATYVDLRLAALNSPNAELPESGRDSILQLHDVTEDQLLEFAEVRGRDPEYMAPVWDEVVARMDGDTVEVPHTQDPAAEG